MIGIAGDNRAHTAVESSHPIRYNEASENTPNSSPERNSG
jgi:hypothetical protein